MPALLLSRYLLPVYAAQTVSQPILNDLQSKKKKKFREDSGSHCLLDEGSYMQEGARDPRSIIKGCETLWDSKSCGGCGGICKNPGSKSSVPLRQQQKKPASHRFAHTYEHIVGSIVL